MDKNLLLLLFLALFFNMHLISAESPLECQFSKSYIYINYTIDNPIDCINVNVTNYCSGDYLKIYFDDCVDIMNKESNITYITGGVEENFDWVQKIYHGDEVLYSAKELSFRQLSSDVGKNWEIILYFNENPSEKMILNVFNNPPTPEMIENNEAIDNSPTMESARLAYEWEINKSSKNESINVKTPNNGNNDYLIYLKFAGFIIIIIIIIIIIFILKRKSLK